MYFIIVPQSYLNFSQRTKHFKRLSEPLPLPPKQRKKREREREQRREKERGSKEEKPRETTKDQAQKVTEGAEKEHSLSRNPCRGTLNEREDEAPKKICFKSKRQIR
jgi:hypothetical protein